MRFICGFFLLFTACQSSVSQIPADNSAAIIGGVTAAPNEFPFLVNIWQNSPKDGFVSHLCGGSLIASKWVLTAAHCLLEDVTDKSQGTVKVAELSVFVGSNKINGEGGRKISVKSILVHPKFTWPKHDIALIELSEDVSDVKPVALNQKDLNSVTTSLQATVAGWGLTDAQGRVDGVDLQKVTIPLITREQCAQDSYPKKFGWTIEPDTLCASSTHDTKSACPGDSGGPLVVLADGVSTQVGVVSWGAACRGANPLAQSAVEGYADVADAYSWIQSVISK